MEKPSEILRRAQVPDFDDYFNAVEWLRERAACGEHPPPKSSADILAWALDELTIQVEQARDDVHAVKQR